MKNYLHLALFTIAVALNVGCDDDKKSQTAPECVGVDCSGHGACVVLGGEAVCACESGYHADGLSCVPDPTPCDEVDCGGHGVCEVNGEDAACVCDDGYHADGLDCAPDNAAPTFSSTPSDQASAMVTYTYAVECEDTDGDALTLARAESDTCGGVLTDQGDGTGTYTFTPAEDAAGTGCTLAITCSDGIDPVTQTAALTIGEEPDEWTLLRMAPFHACGINRGRLYCWGANEAGQLGVGDQAFRMAPTRVGTERGWTDLLLGEATSCGLRDGRRYCWGANGYSFYGDDQMADSQVPVQVDAGSDWTRLSGNFHHHCGVRGGVLYCWGDNLYGQVGNGTSMNTVESPTPVGNPTGWTDVAAGDGHTCGIHGGQLYCWGQAMNHATGHETNQNTPLFVGAETDWTAVVAGRALTCGLRAGALYCMGSNSEGQLGLGAGTPMAETPTRVGGESDWTALDLTDNRVCGLRAGALFCWGSNRFGTLGDGTTDSRDVPTRVGTSDAWTAMGVGPYSTLGAGVDGLLRWGLMQEPVSATALAGDRNGGHGCVLETGGAVSCWGDNTFGQLGDGTTSSSPYLVRASEFVGIALEVGIGEGHTCVLRDDATVWCWGDNARGQLGDGTTTASTSPVQVQGLTDVAALAVGYYFNCALKTDQSVWCWGQGQHGQLGDGTTSDRTTPVQALTGVAQVSAGGYHTCAVRTDGSARCWGRNLFGQLGDNSTTFRTSPTQVLGLGAGSLSSIAAGGRHTCAIKTDGSTWCWGNNQQGQLGVNTATAMYSVPTACHQTGTDNLRLVAGEETTLLLKTDGSPQYAGGNSWIAVPFFSPFPNPPWVVTSTWASLDWFLGLEADGDVLCFAAVSAEGYCAQPYLLNYFGPMRRFDERHTPAQLQ